MGGWQDKRSDRRRHSSSGAFCRASKCHDDISRWIREEQNSWWFQENTPLLKRHFVPLVLGTDHLFAQENLNLNSQIQPCCIIIFIFGACFNYVMNNCTNISFDFAVFSFGATIHCRSITLIKTQLQTSFLKKSLTKTGKTKISHLKFSLINPGLLLGLVINRNIRN